jgi:hemerythrin superfamily protein
MPPAAASSKVRALPTTARRALVCARRASAREATRGAAVAGTRGARRSTMAGNAHSHVIDALEVLAEQHDNVDDLFERLRAAGGDKRALFDQLADTLAAHSMIEEKLFYPSVMSDETEPLLREAVEDHLEMKRMLAELMDLEFDDDEFDELLGELEDSVSRHARDEEEGKLFPLVRDLLDGEQRATLGNELLALFDKLMIESPRERVPEETSEAAPLPGR